MLPMVRIALCSIFLWFGLLKIFSASPAEEMINQLFSMTIGSWFSFISFSGFMIFWGIYEILIGLFFVIPKMERVAFLLFLIHILTTLLPLIILPAFTWTNFLVPTISGQYIIKNIALLSCAIVVLAHTSPFSRRYLDVGPISSFR